MLVKPCRKGLTLVELLVVIALIVVLATLAVYYVAPAFQDNKNVVRGMDRVVTTLLIARQRALRDQGPRGVRFVVDTATGYARDMVYVEQPDPYRTGSVRITPNASTGKGLATFTGSNLFGSAVPGSVEDYAVQPGDWLQVNGTNNFEIESVDTATTATLRRSANIASNAYFKAIRQARPMTGEEAVKLPQNVVVNLRAMGLPLLFPTDPPAGDATQSYGPYQVPVRTTTAATGIYEIVFDPSGGVINRPSGTPIVLWVNDETVDDPAASNTTRLVAIYPRTGLIGTHPRGPAGNLLQFALDGKNSGM